MSEKLISFNSNKPPRSATYSNQLVIDVTIVPVFLRPRGWIVDGLLLASRLCCVVPEVDKELEFEQAGMESLLQIVAFR